MAKEWFFQVMGSEIGPVSSADLKQRVLRGQIQPDTLVRAAPDGKWQSADRIKGLIDPPASAPVAAPAAPKANAPGSNFQIAMTDTTDSIPLMGTAPVERTYHMKGDTSVDITPPDEPASGEYDFFQFVGFEQALGLKLHRALIDHCHKQHLTLTEVTRRAIAVFLNRKDLLEEAPPEATAEPTTASPPPA